MSLRVPEPEVILSRTIGVDDCVKFELELAKAFFPELKDKLVINQQFKEVFYLNDKNWPAVTPQYTRELRAAAALIFDLDLSIDRRVHRLTKISNPVSNATRWSYLDGSNGTNPVLFFHDKQTAFCWMIATLAMKERMKRKVANQNGESNA